MIYMMPTDISEALIDGQTQFSMGSESASLSVNLLNIRGKLINRYRSILTPGTMLQLYVALGDSPEATLGIFFIDRASVSYPEEKITVSARDAVGKLLKEQTFDENLSGLGIGSWTCPRGGYLISFDSLPGCAAAIVDKAKKAGVKLTPAGATWPYHHDPNDSNIRIAPTYPPMEDLKTAANLFTLCVRMVSAEKLLKEKKEAVPVSEKNEI